MKPEESLYFLQAAQKLARYHQTLGIDHYPATAKLSALLLGPRQNELPANLNPSGKVSQPQTAPPNRGTTPPVMNEQAAAMASVELVGLKNCRLCAASDIQPLTAQAGQAGQEPKLLVVGDYRHDADGDFIFGQKEDELLTKMLTAIALSNEDVGITNLVKCRPATEAGPGEAVAERCLVHLSRQVLAIQPRLILAMGDLPARILVGKNASVSALRNRLHNFFPQENQPVPVLVSYHPTFLLAQSEMKKAAWEDLKMARRFLASLPLTTVAAKS